MKAFMAAALALGVLFARPPVLGEQASEHWIGTWYAAPTARIDSPTAATPGATGTSGQSLLHFSNQTLRQVAHITLGGSRVRVVIANTFGTAALDHLNAAGYQAAAAAIDLSLFRLRS
jgi:hypothetical protein